MFVHMNVHMKHVFLTSHRTANSLCNLLEHHRAAFRWLRTSGLNVVATDKDGTFAVMKSTVFDEMVAEMVSHDLDQARQQALLKQSGFKVTAPQE